MKITLTTPEERKFWAKIVPILEHEKIEWRAEERGDEVVIYFLNKHDS